MLKEVARGLCASVAGKRDERNVAQHIMVRASAKKASADEKTLR